MALQLYKGKPNISKHLEGLLKKAQADFTGLSEVTYTLLIIHFRL